VTDPARHSSLIQVNEMIRPGRVGGLELSHHLT